MSGMAERVAEGKLSVKGAVKFAQDMTKEGCTKAGFFFCVRTPERMTHMPSLCFVSGYCFKTTPLAGEREAACYIVSHVL